MGFCELRNLTRGQIGYGNCGADSCSLARGSCLRLHTVVSAKVGICFFLARIQTLKWTGQGRRYDLCRSVPAVC